MKTRRHSILLVLLAMPLLGAVLSIIPACNTVEGVGKDTANAGEAIEKAAEEHK